jgi:hypothetical protein
MVDLGQPCRCMEALRRNDVNAQRRYSRSHVATKRIVSGVVWHSSDGGEVELLHKIIISNKLR